MKSEINIGNIIKFGLFNSKKAYENLQITPYRIVQYFEFDYILSCEKNATSYIDDKVCKLAPNILIIRKPGQRSNSRLHYKCFCLHLKIERDNPLFDDLYSTPEYFTLINDKTYQKLFETLFQHLIKKHDFSNDYFTSAKILELIYYVKKDEKRNQKAKQTSLKKEKRSIQKIISYIKQHYQEDISLKKLGELMNYSPNHLQRIFTDVMGVSPQNYLEKVRVDYAKYLLAQEEHTLTDIAYLCGFSSQSYFSKVFKKHTALTPYAFRQKSAFKYDDSTKRIN